MKVYLACDDYIYAHNGHYYAASQEKYEFYQRYLRIFDELKLVARCVEEKELKQGRIYFKDKRIEICPMPMFRGPKEYVVLYNRIGRLLKQSITGCDAAILRIPSTVALRAGKYVRRAGLPYAIEVVYDAKDGWQSSKGLIDKILWRLIDRDMRQLCYYSRGVSCVTEFHLQKRYYSKRKDSFVSHYSSLSLAKEFYASPRIFPKKEILTIGHVATQVDFDGVKGHKELIEAVAILKNKGIDVKVLFAGGDYLGGVNALSNYAAALGVSNMIEFVGALNRTELSVFYEKIDLFVLPTRAEGLPRVIIEAISKGLPCVSTNVSGNPELLPAHYLVDFTDVVGLADRIVELLTNKGAYEQASKENYEKSLKYESSILERRRDAFYQSLRNATV